MGRGHELGGDWARTEAGIGALQEAFKDFGDRHEMGVPATWFLRADRLVTQQFGDPIHVIRMFSRLGGMPERDRDEIGWMPQVYEGDRPEVFYDDLSQIYEKIGAVGPLPRSVRMGDCFHDNRTMKIISELGVRVDSSAVPGRQKSDGGWRMNWIGTPERAFHPSMEDYRTPGSSRLEVLEVPLSVSPLAAPYDSAPLLRYLNPCMRREYFLEGIQRLLLSSDYLVMVLHPDEVVPGRPQERHPLVAYSVDEVAANLDDLMRRAILLDRVISFHTLQDFIVDPSRE